MKAIVVPRLGPRRIDLCVVAMGGSVPKVSVVVQDGSTSLVPNAAGRAAWHVRHRAEGS
jgi:hypothetical protein